jgi:hypothetical protein
VNVKVKFAGNQSKPVVVCVVHVTLMMTEQHIRTKFCQKLGHSCSETYNMIQKAFGNKTMGCTHVKDGLGS